MLLIGHQHGFGRGAAAVVQAGVRDIEAGEPRDERLIFEHDLQVALADFGLVRRVGRVELAAAGELIDGGRNEVVVAAAAEEADFGAGVLVLGREGGHVLRELDLAHRGRNIELPLEPQIGGTISNRSSIDFSADRGEHCGLVFGRVVEIGHREVNDE